MKLDTKITCPRLEQLRTQMEDKEISQEDIAKYLEISTMEYQCLEDHRLPTIDDLIGLCSYYDVAYHTMIEFLAGVIEFDELYKQTQKHLEKVELENSWEVTTYDRSFISINFIDGMKDFTFDCCNVFALKLLENNIFFMILNDSTELKFKFKKEVSNKRAQVLFADIKMEWKHVRNKMYGMFGPHWKF